VKALITGAAGFIGSHLTTALLDRGAEVTGIDCFTDYYPRFIKEMNLKVNSSRPGYTFVESSLQDADLPALLRDKTHVFHLAAQAGVRKSWGADFRVYTDNNVDATQQLLEACVGLPLHRVVYASSSSVYGDNVSIPMREDALPQPVSPYGVTKLAAEQLCYLYHANHRVPTTSVRYFTVYGPRQRPDMAFHKFMKAVLRGDQVTLYGDGEQTRDFTFVTDAVAATVAAGDKGVPGRAYNIGGGSRVSVNQLFAIIERIAGKPLNIKREPSQKGDMRDTFADSTLARQDLGFAPKVTLEQGLEAEYRWLENTPALLEPSAAS
jgi:UDP-glucose 4-epimerase